MQRHFWVLTLANSSVLAMDLMSLCVVQAVFCSFVGKLPAPICLHHPHCLVMWWRQMAYQPTTPHRTPCSSPTPTLFYLPPSLLDHFDIDSWGPHARPASCDTLRPGQSSNRLKFCVSAFLSGRVFVGGGGGGFHNACCFVCVV